MTQLANPDFHGSERFRPHRPNLLRRVARRYQVVELFIIIGGILLLWGGTSLGKIHGTLNGTPPAWADSVQSVIGAAFRGEKPAP